MTKTTKQYGERDTTRRGLAGEAWYSGWYELEGLREIRRSEGKTGWDVILEIGGRAVPVDEKTLSTDRALTEFSIELIQDLESGSSSWLFGPAELLLIGADWQEGEPYLLRWVSVPGLRWFVSRYPHLWQKKVIPPEEAGGPPSSWGWTLCAYASWAHLQDYGVALRAYGASDPEELLDREWV